MKPSAATEDPPAETKATKTMEIVLATLPLPAKADPTSKGPEVSEATSTKHIHDLSKDKIIVKKKQFLVQFYLSNLVIKVTPFVSNQPPSEVLVNENYEQFLYFYDFYISVDIVSFLSNI